MSYFLNLKIISVQKLLDFVRRHLLLPLLAKEIRQPGVFQLVRLDPVVLKHLEYGIGGHGSAHPRVD